MAWSGYPASLAASPDYFVRTWQAEQGLPQNKVTAVVQTHDGYLWAGTYSGLAQFDGVHFTVFDEDNTPALRSSRITSLCESPDGSLWIGDESGQVTRYRDGRFEAVPFHPAWSGGKIYDMAADDAGDVWLLNEAGQLVRLRDERVLTPEAGTATKLVDLTRSPNGTIWVARDGRVSELAHGKLRPLQFAAGSNNTYVMGIGASRDGGLWVVADQRIRKWKDGKWVKDLGAAPWQASPPTRLIETRRGVLAVGTADRGFYLLFPNQTEKPQHFNHAARFPSDWVISLCEDREGNIWAGTGGGLVMLRPNNIQSVSPPDQWQGRAVLSVWPGRQGTLWVGTEGAGLYRLQTNVWTNFGSAQGIQNLYVWSLAEDDQGRLWVGTWGGGLFVQNDGHFDFAPGLENSTPPMPALLNARDGSLWVGTEPGLLHYQTGKTNWFTEHNGQALRDVRTIAEDTQGNIWFGMAGSGLASLSHGAIRQFRKADGLSSDFIECLHFDRAGALWIGTFGGGLDRYQDGRFAVINRKQGLPDKVIGDIEEDDRGYFWMSSHIGIIRASETELNLCADGKIGEVRCQTYGINDGMPTIECSEGLQPAGCKTADGRIWFPTSKGLVAVNPLDVQTNPLPPPVIIEQTLVDEHPLTTGKLGTAPLTISPGRHRFEFHYTGLSFVDPDKVQFKYRLKGFDTNWFNAGTKRMVNYNYIPPGNYSFQVTACNNDGVWNNKGATLSFVVLPFFWQTMWFRVLAWITVVGISGWLVWYDTRRRMRLKLERLERQQAIERERARIAHDIHDDLGAHLTRITMLSESARGDANNPVQTAAGLNQIYDTASELTRAMDEIVWAVNPQHDTLESLASYLEKFAQDLLATADIRCRLDLPMQFPDWRLSAEVRHNFFLAFKEALHNVVKHSGASKVQIRLTTKTSSFELIIEDNGCGFAPGAEMKTTRDVLVRFSPGNGLANMNRRLEAIGGKCEVQSKPGHGTIVHFIVPRPKMESEAK